MSPNYLNAYLTYHRDEGQFTPPLVCVDGFAMSVQASDAHYCSPRDNAGPWTQVEVGFPTDRVEELMAYCEDPETPTKTVYGYVPVEVVCAVVEAHGGLA
jgi:hypothetical protein